MPPLSGTPPGAGAPGARTEEQAAAEAFAREALTHLDALYAFARWLVGSPADAEDLVQETMLKGLRARASFRPGTNLRAWLFTILRRTFLNARARSGRELLAPPTGSAAAGDAREAGGENSGSRHGGLDRLPDVPFDPEPALFAAVSREAIDAALAALPLEFREAVWLADVEEMTLTEAAEVLGCPIGTVKSRLSRGRALLRASLKDYAR